MNRLLNSKLTTTQAPAHTPPLHTPGIEEQHPLRQLCHPFQKLDPEAAKAWRCAELNSVKPLNIFMPCVILWPDAFLQALSR
jgi:hypothetical protein